MEEWQISLARSVAGAGGHENPTFHVGGVTDLPFEDDSFDAAHCHAVLMHVLDTQAVLAEVKRILKPGGIISSREMTVAFSFLEPLLGSTEAAWDTFSEPYRSQWLRPPRIIGRISLVLPDLDLGPSSIETSADGQFLPDFAPDALTRAG